MEARVKKRSSRLLVFAGLVSALVALPAMAADEEDPFATDPLFGWTPALGLVSGIVGQGSDAAVSSSVRPPAAGDDFLVMPLVGLNAEIMAPALSLPGRPRPFFQAGLLPNFGFDRDVAKEADPGAFGISGNPLEPGDLGTPTDPRNVPEETITGVGSQTRVKPVRLMWTAGVGLAFDFQAADLPMRFKTSIEWIRYTLELEGLVHRAVKPDPNDPATRFIEITGSEDFDNDAIGPGFELEVDAGRTGHMGFSVFLGFNAYRLLGNRQSKFSGSFDDGVVETADFSVELDPWVFRGGLGFRFRWLP